MNIVNERAAISIGFIGTGRVANTLARALHNAGFEVVAVASRTIESAQRLADVIPGCRAMPNQQAVVDAAMLVFLTVPDDAIEPLASSLRWRGDMAAVHCSGATEISALAVAAEAGAQTGGFHPLHAFADPLVALANLPGCAVAIEADEPLFGRLNALADALQLRPLRLPPGSRAIYHLSGSFAASFIDGLLHEAVELWQQRLGVSREQALAALLPLARGTLDSIARMGTVAALTGPISRGDAGTVERHFEALRHDHSQTLKLYALLAQRSLAMAIERGTLTDAQRTALERLLASVAKED
jgi:predicted short-subunit dehydrogenase-like oxidoreductase (DUF2520 family)